MKRSILQQSNYNLISWFNSILNVDHHLLGINSNINEYYL